MPYFPPKHRSFFTFERLVSVFLGLVSVMVLVFVFTGIFFSAGEDAVVVRQNAERYAREHVRTFYGWQQPVVQCFGRDTDGNGYVTCTVASEVGGTHRQVECAANYSLEFYTGCRQPQLRTLDINSNQ